MFQQEKLAKSNCSKYERNAQRRSPGFSLQRGRVGKALGTRLKKFSEYISIL